MPSVDEWKRLRTRYRNLKSNSKKVLDELNSCKGYISTASASVSNALVYEDDDSVDGGKFNSMSTSVYQMANKLRDKVIPAINNKIDDINDEIEKAEAEAG